MQKDDYEGTTLVEDVEVEAPAPVASASGLLSADEILAGTDPSRLEYIDVPVPEWTPGYGDPKAGDIKPKKVRLRVMTGDEAMEFADHQQALSVPLQPGQPKPKRDSMIRLVCQCAVDNDGNPLFTEAQLTQLGGLSFAVLQRLQDAALVLNGFAKEDDAQEAAGNG